MRTLLRMLFCAVVLAAMVGCGGGSTSEIPKKFAPMPGKDAQSVSSQRTPVTLPPTKTKGG